MLVGGVRQVQFETASATADWVFPYILLVPTVTSWDDLQDEVVIGMSPDSITWDDYGLRSRIFPPRSGSYDAAPWFFASSDDGSGCVTLVDPNRVNIIVPYGAIRSMGVGSVSVGIQYRNKLLDRRTTLLTGRLPLTDGGV